MATTHIFFDFAGVLYKCEFNRETLLKAHLLALNQLLSNGLDMNIAKLEKLYENVIFQYNQEKHKREWSLREILSKVFNGNADEELLDKLESIYKSNSGIAEPYPSTRIVIPKLAEMFELGIISNCPHDSLKDELRKHSLHNYFKTITLSGEVGYRKPDSRIYLSALEKASAEPENSVYIYHDEIEGKGAEAVGMQSILVENGNLETLLEVIGEHG